MQSIQNSIPTTQSRAEVDAPANTSPASIVNSLPPEALYAKSFQPLYSDVNPRQDNEISTRPVAFRLSTTQAQLAQDPQQLSSSLQSASQGLGGMLNGLDTSGTSDQINQLIQSAQDAAANGDGLTAQKEMAQAQLLYSTMSTLLSMISSLQMEAIRNAKIQ